MGVGKQSVDKCIGRWYLFCFVVEYPCEFGFDYMTVGATIWMIYLPFYIVTLLGNCWRQCCCCLCDPLVSLIEQYNKSLTRAKNKNLTVHFQPHSSLYFIGMFRNDLWFFQTMLMWMRKIQLHWPGVVHNVHISR